jgi:polysaccharide deacetylase family protein (PEP-CTERM system associated)
VINKQTDIKTPAAMSIDVEDWFQVQNLAIDPSKWESHERRVEQNVDRMLELLDDNGVKCTCFILGWIAQRHGETIKRIANAGHEIASHGYNHQLIYDLSHDEFREDIRSTKQLLEDLTSKEVVGYRAPCFSITDWSIDILAEEGYTYDSSSFPTVAHDRYGKLTGMKKGVVVQEIRDGFHEVCVSCLNILGKGLPWAGGGYFRLLPYWIFRAGVRRILRSKQPYVFYIHPWEIDAGQPRVKGLGRQYAFRHYLNLKKCSGRWDRLLGDFDWVTVGELLQQQLQTTAQD